MFRAVAAPGGWRAPRTPAQGIGERFDADGATVSSGALVLGMQLQGLSFAGGSAGVADSPPKARANRVSYARPGVTEWYRNGPQGLEQGFTVLRAPASSEGGLLTLMLALSGNAHPALARDARSVVLRKGSAALTYGALVATDAAGRTLRSRLALQSGRLQLRIDSAGARYRLTVDPLIQKGEKRLAAARKPASERARRSRPMAARCSSARRRPMDRWTRCGCSNASAAGWQQQAELEAPPAVSEPKPEERAEESVEEAGECAFGASVALSADGNTALVGQPSPNSTAGSAWIFTRAGRGRRRCGHARRNR